MHIKVRYKNALIGHSREPGPIERYNLLCNQNSSPVLIGSKPRPILHNQLARTIQLFWERLSEKNVHATIPKGNMGYDQYTVPDTVAVEPTFVAFL